MTSDEERLRLLVERVRAKERYKRALRALNDFGHVIATVARARMVSMVAAGLSLRCDPSDEVGVSVNVWRGAESTEFAIVRYTVVRPGCGTRLATIVGDPEDVAAQVVERLLEEAGRG